MKEHSISVIFLTVTSKSGRGKCTIDCYWELQLIEKNFIPDCIFPTVSIISKSSSLWSVFLKSSVWSKTSDNLVVNLFQSFVSHSQIVSTLHPISLNAFWFFRSRVTFPSNFVTQNSVFDLGIVDILHPWCLCQKQPWTRTINLCLKDKVRFPR